MPTASDLTEAKELSLVYTVELEPVVPQAPADPPFVELGLGITPIARYDTSFRSTSIPTTTTVYYSDVGFVTGSGDTPAHTAFKPYVKSAVDWSRDLRTGRRLGGRVAFRAGGATFYNADGEFDNFLTSYAIDGRTVRVKAGLAHWAYTDFVSLFDQTAEAFEGARRNEVSAILRGSYYLLQTPLQPNTYEGTGGPEGGADLQGRRKPLAFGGRIKNVNPPRLNNLNIYQLHDGEIDSVQAVFDRGVELTFNADYATYSDLANASITGGEYGTCLAEGYIRLGTEPAGLVTVDFKGAIIDGSFTDQIGDIIESVLTDYGPKFASSRIDGSSFTNLKNNVTDPVEFWFGTNRVTAARAVETMLDTFEGFLSDKRDGTFQVGQVKKPSGSPIIQITEGDTYNWRWLSLPRDVSPAIDRAEVGYAFNYNVQDVDLDTAVTSSRRDFIAQRVRYFALDDPNVTDFHQEAQVLTVNSHWTTETGATNHANQLIDLYSRSTRLLEVQISHKGFATEIDDVVRVTLPSARISGEVFRAIGVSVQANRNRTTLVLLQ